jgi:hypothetical protein
VCGGALVHVRGGEVLYTSETVEAMRGVLEAQGAARDAVGALLAIGCPFDLREVLQTEKPIFVQSCIL